MKKFAKLSIIYLLLLSSFTYHQKTDASLVNNLKITATLAIIAITSYAILTYITSSENNSVNKETKKKIKKILKTVDNTCSTFNKNVNKKFGLNIDTYVKKAKKNIAKVADICNNTWKSFKENMAKNHNINIDEHIKNGLQATQNFFNNTIEKVQELLPNK